MALLWVACSHFGGGLQAQELPDSIVERVYETPADTYASTGVQLLVELARSARGSNLQGIENYEATMRERIYVGLAGGAFRRERGLFSQQRIARVRWENDGDQIIQWKGVRARVPIVGGSEGAQREIDEDMQSALAQDGDPMILSLDPGKFELALSDAVHPLSDSAAVYYRYALGDTLNLTLPSDGRRITMAEVQVEPRENRFDLVAASLWFDIDTGELVRATYRPARPFDLEIDEPGDADDVPRLLRPIRAELKYVTVEYGLYEFKYWLPRRFAMEGEGTAGRFLRVPITIEWSMREYLVNETESEILDFAESLPPGWTRAEQRVEEDDGSVRYVTLLVPPADSVLNHPELTDDAVGSQPLEFDGEELSELKETLQGISPLQLFSGPQIRFGLREGLVRFNRVEGLSVGARADVPVNATMTAFAEARLGVADLEPNGELGLRRGDADNAIQFSLFRRLAHTADFDDPFDLPSSFSALVLGDDRAEYYRTLGAELSGERRTRRTEQSARLFVERHRSARRETTFHLFKAFRPGDVPPTIVAQEDDYVGIAAKIDWFNGTDPTRMTQFGSFGVELGTSVLEGGRTYTRGVGSVGVTGPVFGRLAAAIEVGGGLANDAPPQKEFFLGGASTVRGFTVGAARGNGMVFGRAELATAFPAARVSLFTDVADAGLFGYTCSDTDSEEANACRRSLGFDWDKALASVGVGVSLLDGIFRLDGAWAVKNGSGFRLHAYLDGIF